MDTANDALYTIGGIIEEASLIEEKKSKFICRLYPVGSEKEALDMIDVVCKRYTDASHNCYAYIIMSNGVCQKRFSDDNEPKGTAGMPILRALENKNICNVLAVVTRYFGGTLLGAGRLTRTYAKAASTAIENAVLVRITQMTEIALKATYHDYNRIMGLFPELGITIVDQDYGALVTARLKTEKQRLDEACYRINEITNGRAIVKFEQ